MRLTQLALLLTALLLSSCGNSYMLYETRYIPEPGERISRAEYAQLPWKEPYLEGQSAPHTPSRNAVPKYQTPAKHQVNRGTRAFHHKGDYSRQGDGYQGMRRVENAFEPVPATPPKIKPVD